MMRQVLARVVALLGIAAALALPAPLAAQNLLLGVGPSYGAVSGPSFVSAPSQALGGGSAGVFDSGNAEGWSVTCPACSVGQTFTVARAGYTSAATPVATTYTDTFTVTQQLRQAWFTPGYPGTPSGAAVTAAYPLNTANLWALSDYVLATDTPSGFANNSTLHAPKPVCNWDEPGRTMVGNSLHVGAVCFSRDARNQSQVAAMVFTATDGTTTVSATATSMTLSTYGGDQNAVLDYEVTFNLAALADNHLVTVNAKSYPWIGDSASVQDSSLSSVIREFSPRYYLKNTTRAAAPYLAYVCPAVSVGSCPATAASDTTGVWSATAATAAATPFATIAGALNAIDNASRGIPAGAGLVIGATDGAVIRLGAGTSALSGVTSSRVQNVAAVTITRDPAVTRAQAILSNGTGGSRFRLADGGTLTAPVTESAVRITDVSFVRSSSATLLNGTSSTVQVEIALDNINFDNSSSSYTASLLSNSHLYVYGMTVLHGAVPTFTPAGVAGVTEMRILRGLSLAGPASNIDAWLVLGSTITNMVTLNTGSRLSNKMIVAFNKFLIPGSSQALLSVVGSATDSVADGAAIVQNLIENTYSNYATGCCFFSADVGATVANNINNMIVQYNTFTGVGYVGRLFFEYDQLAGGARFYRFPGLRGNIFPLLATKTDVYDGTQQGDTTTGANAPQNRTGAWATMYSVGSADNLHMMIDAKSGGFGGDRMAAYPGLRAKYNVATTLSSDWYNPLFVNYQGTTITPGSDASVAGSYTAGAGGGDYHLQSGSPCKGVMPVSGLPNTLDGTARSATADNCGAY